MGRQIRKKTKEIKYEPIGYHAENKMPPNIEFIKDDAAVVQDCVAAADPDVSEEEERDPVTLVATSVVPSPNEKHIVTNPAAAAATTEETEAVVRPGNTGPASTSSSAAATTKNKLGWWRSGGMHLTVNLGFPVIVIGSVSVLLQAVSPHWVQAYITLVVGCGALSVYGGMRTAYCCLLVPIYLTSLLLAGTLDVSTTLTNIGMEIPVSITRRLPPSVLAGVVFIVIAVAVAVVKVNICMSVCLHRYAAHQGFKCGPVTALCINLLGCCAMQGGPVWWAAEHRCHHKHCDAPRDPHSPIQVGIENAFAFFLFHPHVEEDYVPYHMDSTLNRILDTWGAWLVVVAEMVVAWRYGGREGLFVAYTSGWICQTITLWFNIVNHPPTLTTTNSRTGKPLVCKASDDYRLHKAQPISYYYVPFHFLDILFPLFTTFVMEDEHKHHHEHARLAKRSWYDPAYWGFIKPLEVCGLVWDVQI